MRFLFIFFLVSSFILPYCSQEISKAPVLDDTSGSCMESWSCSDWSLCRNNTQTRICIEENKCGTTLDIPALKQDCYSGHESNNKRHNKYGRLF